MTEVPLLSPFYRWGNWPFQDHTALSGRVRITAQILSNFRICPSTLHCITSNDSGLISKINKRGKFVLLVTNFKNILETEGTFQNMNNSQIQSYKYYFYSQIHINNDGNLTQWTSHKHNFSRVLIHVYYWKFNGNTLYILPSFAVNVKLFYEINFS